MKSYDELKESYDELVTRWHRQARLVQRMRKEEANPSDIMDAEAELGRISRQRDDVERALIASGNQRQIAHRGRLTGLRQTLIDGYYAQCMGIARSVAMLQELDQRLNQPVGAPALGRLFLPSWDGSRHKCSDSSGWLEHLTLPEHAAAARAALDDILESTCKELA
jgi:hypothetical protein